MLSFLVGPGAPSSPGSGRERSSRAGRGETARPGGYSGGPAVVFTGDTLFRNSVGGVRAPGHTSYTDLRDSIMGTLMELPGETIIYPGHAARARSPRSGSPTASSAYGGGLTPRAQSPAPRWGSRRRSCCSQRTTTAAPRRGCAGPMAQTTSCPARGCSAAAERMARESEKIPTSRVRRTATVASLAASEAVKQFGTRAANVTRGEQAAEQAMARRQLETAKQIVAALGTMKGAAMKLGQVMSFLDVGLVAEELDYELEASNQRALARIFAGHPFIFVPDVVSTLSRERVLVSEFVEGVGFEELRRRPQQLRDRIGEIVFRFFAGCLYRHRQFSGDPHPGNFLLLDDGRMAFLDFGLFKRMEAHAVELELACQRAVAEGDALTLHTLLADSGFLPQPERVDPEHLLAFVGDAIWWYTTADEPVKLSPEIATAVMIESSDPRSSHFREMRHQDMRPEHLFGRRMEMLTLAVLSQLRARANWHRIAREWIYGDEPVTELGRAEAEFYGHSGVGAPG